MEKKYNKLFKINNIDDMTFNHTSTNTMNDKNPKIINNDTEKKSVQKLSKSENSDKHIQKKVKKHFVKKSKIEKDSIINKEMVKQRPNNNISNNQQLFNNLNLIQPGYVQNPHRQNTLITRNEVNTWQINTINTFTQPNYNQNYSIKFPNQIYISTPKQYYIQNPINISYQNYYNNIYTNLTPRINYVNIQHIINIQLLNSNKHRDCVITMIKDIIGEKLCDGFSVCNLNNNNNNFLYFNYPKNIKEGHLYFNNHNIKVLINKSNSIFRVDNDGTYIFGKNNHGVALRRITYKNNIYFFHLDSQNNQNFVSELLTLYPNSIICNLNLDSIQQNPHNIKDLADYNSCAIWAYTNAIALSKMNLNSIIQNNLPFIDLANINIDIQDIKEAPFKLIKENNKIKIVEVIDVDEIMAKDVQAFDVDNINTYQMANKEFDKIFNVNCSKNIE